MKIETKVGWLAILSLVMVAIFAYLMGFGGYFGGSEEIHVMYNYAGGLEEGSPVRVMGIKVGRVKRIEFFPDFKMPNGEQVKLQVTIVVDKKAWSSIREDSRYFINLAGVIGEKFLEITPGSVEKTVVKAGDTVRGEDPPRIDQLISQSYGLAGKIIELVEKNEGSVTDIISQLDHLLTNFNKTLALLDKTSKNKDMVRLLDNAVKLSDDLTAITAALRSQNAQDTYSLVQRLIKRLEGLDGPAIRKFLQEEGIKAHLF